MSKRTILTVLGVALWGAAPAATRADQTETILNDTCDAALPVCPGVYFGNTDGQNTEGSATCGSSNNSPDVWFSYTPAYDGTLVVDTKGAGTGYDTVLSIHTGCVGTISNELACDECNCETSHRSSRIEIEVKAEVVYIIRLSGHNTADGDYELRVTGPDCVHDCNVNGTPDQVEIAAGSADDCNVNGVPDNCDINDGHSMDVFGELDGNPSADSVPDECQRDCNGNGEPDIRDLVGLTSADCNSNLTPDECELGGNDCNSNGVPDECDIDSGDSLDSLPAGGDGVPDECQDDCNANGVLDGVDIAGGTSPDCNDNAVPDECDTAVNDCDGNGVPDDCQLSGNDCNGNGVPDGCDVRSDASADCNDDLIPDECQLATGDCNGNGRLDACDVKLNFSGDCNANLTPDECELAAGSAEDCNGNNRPDTCDIAKGETSDCDGNGVPDGCELAGNDCNDNDIHDACDILAGREIDVIPSGGDGIPDRCNDTGADEDGEGRGGEGDQDGGQDGSNNGGGGNQSGGGTQNGGDDQDDGGGDQNGGGVMPLPDGFYQLTDKSGNIVIILPPAGVQLGGGGFVDPIQLPAPPVTVTLPQGVLTYVLTGVEVGGKITVVITFEPGTVIDTWYKFGPTPDNPVPHWYEFLFDGQTGAEINGNVVTLHLIDGGRGDDDLTANGEIASTEAPVLLLAGVPVGLPGQECGAGLCGVGGAGMMPFMLLGCIVMRRGGRRRTFRM